MIQIVLFLTTVTTLCAMYVVSYYNAKATEIKRLRRQFQEKEYNRYQEIKKTFIECLEYATNYRVKYDIEFSPNELLYQFATSNDYIIIDSCYKFGSLEKDLMDIRITYNVDDYTPFRLFIHRIRVTMLYENGAVLIDYKKKFYTYLYLAVEELQKIEDSLPVIKD